MAAARLQRIPFAELPPSAKAVFGTAKNRVVCRVRPAGPDGGQITYYVSDRGETTEWVWHADAGAFHAGYTYSGCPRPLRAGGV
jgi:hypothetical protein